MLVIDVPHHHCATTTTDTVTPTVTPTVAMTTNIETTERPSTTVNMTVCACMSFAMSNKVAFQS